MTTSIAARRVVAALGCAAALLLTAVVAEPAAAQAPGSRPAQPLPTVLVMAVVPLAEPATVATLTCDPPGGTHPQQDVACRDIAWADGDLNALPGDPYAGACAPNTPPWPGYATAFGFWRGRFVWTTQYFANRCVISETAGRAFAMLVSNVWVPDDEPPFPCPPGRPCPAP